MSGAWDLDGICDACARAVRAQADARDAEQAPLGVDALDELSLHPILRGAIGAAGYGAHAEQRYPGSRSRPKRSEGERCDIVLVVGAEEHLLDPLSAGTLFGERGCEPEAALWIEVKAVGQFAVIDGVGRANPGYSGELLTGVTADARKLAADERIAHGALLLVLFTADEATATHDLGAWRERAAVKGVRTGAPFVRGFPITDRIGNGWCLVAVVPVFRL